jgi:mannose-6-phosphate isomerase-like protein (cupin superfamily)
LVARFPACPPAVVDEFIELVTQDSEVLASRAELILQKPYGRNCILRASGTWGLSFAQLEPGRGTSTHMHAQRRELFCVRRGQLKLTAGGEQRILNVGELGESKPHEPHSIANAGSSLLEIAELFSPALLDDKVRLHDPYGRAVGAVTLHQ